MVVFHHDLARATVLAWLALGGVTVLGAEPADRPGRAATVLAVACLGAAFGWCPAVAVDDDAVTVVNPWRTTRIPWNRVADLYQGWTLTIRLTDERAGLDGPGAAAVHAWACPGPRRMRSLWERHASDGGVMVRDSLSALDAGAGLARLGLGDAALIVAQRWAARAALTTGPVTRASSTTPRLLVAAGLVLAVAATVL